MNLIAVLLLSQLAAPAQSPAVLEFPEAGLDDTAAYQGYRTRFYRDGAGNTVQIYLNRLDGRVVHLLADSENGSIGLSVRGARGQGVPLAWSGDARVSRRDRTRTLEHDLVADARQIHLGWFLLGSMRVERDFQYWRRHRAPFASPPFALEEMERLLAAIGRLDAVEQRRHLALLNAPSLAVLRARLRPTISITGGRSTWSARVTQPSLDARDTMAVEIIVDTRRVTSTRAGDSLSLTATGESRVPFTVRIATTGAPLTPLARTEIFTPEFLAFVVDAQWAASASGAADTTRTRARWLERQVRGVELLVSREKLMAGLPAYATYFGRDMLLSALMMRPIWRDEMSEFAVASALRKLSPSGQVSHEEALGGQADREAASEYAALIADYFRLRPTNRLRATAILARAREVLRDHRRVRENYHMIDDEFQLPILAARWISDADVTAQRKRAFLADSSDGGGTRLARLLKELALVARMTADYVASPIAANLVSFPPRDSSRWSSASWRDSGAGYAGGRFAMDVNAIWVPHALESTGQILEAIRELGFSLDSLGAALPDLAADTPLGRYVRDPSALRNAADAWWNASRHFLVGLSVAEVRARVGARLAAMPAAEREHWNAVLARSRADQDSLAFLALSLDARGQPIGVANSDPATRLFLGERRGIEATNPSVIEGVLRDVRLFARPYPVGLFIDGVGPVVANDAYAPARVWRDFERDHYHGPRVVWGREVNLFLLGVTNRIAAGGDAAYLRELREAMARVVAAVEASGFQSELWSYQVDQRGVQPVRYGTGSDVQLWSTTDLAVQFALWQLARRP